MADFGFARLVSEDPGSTHISTQVKGSAGYVDPEYLRTFQLTDKSDVYSFGVLLIELITGRRPIELKRARQDRLTVKWVSNFSFPRERERESQRLNKEKVVFILCRH